MHYTVKKGDTLYSIAKKYYGKGFMWRLILRYNKGIENPDRIPRGQTIYIPFR